MQAIYISSNQFKVNEDKTGEFLAGRRVRSLCGSEYKYSTVYSSTYSSPDTTITIEESILTSNLSEVHYGIINIGDQGSFPKHSHDGTEGTGGVLSLLTLSDTPSTYDELRYLKTTSSGIEFVDDLYTKSEVNTISGSLQTNIDGKSDTGHIHDDRYYTESEVDTISGTLQTGIDTKSDTEVFLIEGIPSEGVGKLYDVAINKLIGTIYKKEPEYIEDSGTFYPVANTDDGEVSWGAFSTNSPFLGIGSSSGVIRESFIRFPNVTIPASANISSAFVRLTAYNSDTSTICNVKCFMNDHDNAVSPTNLTQFNTLSLTTGTAWDNLSSWVANSSYDTPDIFSEIQTVVNRSGWESGNAMTVVIKNNGSSSSATRFAAALEHSGGSQKAELHITWTEEFGTPTWTENLSPDFIKLSDTPTTYSGSADKYLKTTTSGIEFSDDLYTKSEVDTISGTLQTNIDGKSDTAHLHDDRYYTETEVDIFIDSKSKLFLTDGSPSSDLGEEDDTAIDQNIGTVYLRLEDPVPVTWNPSDKSAGITLSNGNLTAVSTTEAYKAVRSVQSVSSGKYYWEFNIDFVNGFTTRVGVGVGTSSATLDGRVGTDSYGYGYFSPNGYIFYNDIWTAGHDVYITNDIIGVALDLDNGKIWWSRNGVWQDGGDPGAGTGEAYSGLSGTFYAMVDVDDTGSQVTASFGATTFSYSAPSGFTSGLLEGDVWEEKLFPDFLKLSDTPTTYVDSSGKYLKTTSSGIEFSNDELYTKSEVDTISGTLQTNIDGKSDTSHLHDDRYYTETEVDTISGSLQTNIDSMPTTLLELGDTPTTYSGSADKYLKTTNSGIEFSDIDSEYWESVNVFLDENYSNEKGLPVQVERGLFKGYSMPIWATPVHQYEELVFRIRVPFRWDGITDPIFLILVSTSATEDIGDKFKFQMEWESKGVSEVIPDTTAETLTDEVTLTDGTAYYSYLASANLDATKLISGENLQFRIRRIAAAEPQVSNEIIIWHWDSRWKMNKLGTITE